MSSFHPLNLVEDSKKELEEQHTRELQIEQAIQLYQKALSHHQNGELRHSYDVYKEVFKLEIISNHYYEEEALLKGLQNGQASTSVDELSFLSPNVKRLRFLLFRNRGMLYLDMLKAHVASDPPQLPAEAEMPKLKKKKGKPRPEAASGPVIVEIDGQPVDEDGEAMDVDGSPENGSKPGETGQEGGEDGAKVSENGHEGGGDGSQPGQKDSEMAENDSPDAENPSDRVKATQSPSPVPMEVDGPPAEDFSEFHTAPNSPTKAAATPEPAKQAPAGVKSSDAVENGSENAKTEADNAKKEDESTRTDGETTKTDAEKGETGENDPKSSQTGPETPDDANNHDNDPSSQKDGSEEAKSDSEHAEVAKTEPEDTEVSKPDDSEVTKPEDTTETEPQNHPPAPSSPSSPSDESDNEPDHEYALALYQAIADGAYGVVASVTEPPNAEEVVDKFKQMFYSVVDDFCIALLYQEGDERMLAVLHDLYAYVGQHRLARFTLEYSIAGKQESDDLLALLPVDPGVKAELEALVAALEGRERESDLKQASKHDLKQALKHGSKHDSKQSDMSSMTSYSYLDSIKVDFAAQIAQTRAFGRCSISVTGSAATDGPTVDWTTLVDQLDAKVEKNMLDDELVREKRGKRNLVDAYWLTESPIERVSVEVVAKSAPEPEPEPMEVDPEPEPTEVVEVSATGDPVEPAPEEMPQEMRASKRLARVGDSSPDLPATQVAPEDFAESSDFFGAIYRLADHDGAPDQLARWFAAPESAPQPVASFAHALNHWDREMSKSLAGSEADSGADEKIKLLDVVSGFSDSGSSAASQAPPLSDQGVADTVAAINAGNMHYLRAKTAILERLLPTVVTHEWPQKLVATVVRWLVHLSDFAVGKLGPEASVAAYELLVSAYVDRKRELVASVASKRVGPLQLQTVQLRDVVARWEGVVERMVAESAGVAVEGETVEPVAGVTVESAFKPVSNVATKPVSNLATKPVSSLASQSASESAAESASKSASESASKSASEPISTPAAPASSLPARFAWAQVHLYKCYNIYSADNRFVLATVEQMKHRAVPQVAYPNFRSFRPLEPATVASEATTLRVLAMFAKILGPDSNNESIRLVEEILAPSAAASPTVDAIKRFLAASPVEMKLSLWGILFSHYQAQDSAQFQRGFEGFVGAIREYVASDDPGVVVKVVGFVGTLLQAFLGTYLAPRKWQLPAEPDPATFGRLLWLFELVYVFSLHEEASMLTSLKRSVEPRSKASFQSLKDTLVRVATALVVYYEGKGNNSGSKGNNSGKQGETGENSANSGKNSEENSANSANNSGKNQSENSGKNSGKNPNNNPNNNQSKNPDNSSDSSFNPVTFCSTMHAHLGTRQLCADAGGIFLEVCQERVFGADTAEVCQLIFCRHRYALAIDGFAPKQHVRATASTTPRALDRTTTLELAPFILPQCFRRNTLVHPPKHDTRSIIDDFYQVVGDPNFETGPHASALARNHAVLEQFMDTTRLTPRFLREAFHGVARTDVEAVPEAPNYGLVASGLYYLQALTSFGQYKIKKKNMQSRVAELENIIKLLTFDLGYASDRFESWFVLGQAYGFLVEDDMIWTADKLTVSDRKVATANLQRKSVLCYLMAINAVGRTQSPGLDEVVGQLMTCLSREVYSAVMVPMDGYAFRVVDRPAFVRRAGVAQFESVCDRWSAPKRLFLRVVHQGLCVALKADDDDWCNYYYLAKVERKRGKPWREVLAVMAQAAAIAYEDSAQGDRIIEPHYTLVSMVYKYVKSGAMGWEEAVEYLRDDPVIGEGLDEAIREIDGEKEGDGEKEKKDEKEKENKEGTEEGQEKAHEPEADTEMVDVEAEKAGEKAGEKADEKAGETGEKAGENASQTGENASQTGENGSQTGDNASAGENASQTGDKATEASENPSQAETASNPSEAVSKPSEAVSKPSEPSNPSPSNPSEPSKTSEVSATVASSSSSSSSASSSSALTRFYRIVCAALRLVDRYDKRSWHHKPRFRLAQILFDEFGDAKGALALMNTLVFLRTTGKQLITIWKPENERPGKHFYYTWQYAMLYIRLLTAERDLASLMLLLGRLRKSNSIMLNLYHAWDALCQSYNLTVRAAFGYGLKDFSYAESFLSRLTHAQFAAQCKVMMESVAKEIPGELEIYFVLLAATTEMKKLNNGFGPTSVIDDTLLVLFFKIYSYYEERERGKEKGTENGKEKEKEKGQVTGSEAGKATGAKTMASTASGAITGSTASGAITASTATGAPISASTASTTTGAIPPTTGTSGSPCLLPSPGKSTPGPEGHEKPPASPNATVKFKRMAKKEIFPFATDLLKQTKPAVDAMKPRVEVNPWVREQTVLREHEKREQEKREHELRERLRQEAAENARLAEIARREREAREAQEAQERAVREAHEAQEREAREAQERAVREAHEAAGRQHYEAWQRSLYEQQRQAHMRAVWPNQAPPVMVSTPAVQESSAVPANPLTAATPTHTPATPQVVAKKRRNSSTTSSERKRSVPGPESEVIVLDD